MDKNLILIVDDVPKNLQLMGKILRDRGYEIAMATNGKEALETLKDIHPDLILLDIMMPEMDGYETCKIIKANKDFQDIPIIFLTGRSDTDDVVKGLKLGAIDYVSKPFNTSELLLRVSTYLELKKSRDLLRQKNKELEELNASKDKFFSIISHDLKSPFQGLIGLTELLYEDIESMKKEDILEFTKMINESSRNLLSLLENLLEWSVLERNKQQFQPEKTDLKAIIEKNIQLFEANCSKKNVSLQNQVDKEIKAWADRNMIDTVVRNLVSNAIKYTPEGGTISMDAVELDGEVQVTVTDTGVGMDERTRDRLFRLDEMRSHPGTNNEKGTGLGLLICKELVEKNNGDISVESEPGQGSSFTFRLPIRKSAPTYEKTEN